MCVLGFGLFWWVVSYLCVCGVFMVGGMGEVVWRRCSVGRLLCWLEEYLRLSGGYGFPVHTSPRVWGFGDGLFECLNRRLVREGYEPLSWEEFRELLRLFDEPRYYGRI